MKKMLLGLVAIFATLPALGAEQYTFTVATPAGYSSTLLNYFPIPMRSRGLTVEVRGCDATVTGVNTMTAGIGLAQLDYDEEIRENMTSWVTRSGKSRTFLGVQLFTTNRYPAWCTYAIRPLADAIPY